MMTARLTYVMPMARMATTGVNRRGCLKRAPCSVTKLYVTMRTCSMIMSQQRTIHEFCAWTVSISLSPMINFWPKRQSSLCRHWWKWSRLKPGSPPNMRALLKILKSSATARMMLWCEMVNKLARSYLCERVVLGYEKIWPSRRRMYTLRIIPMLGTSSNQLMTRSLM